LTQKALLINSSILVKENTQKVFKFKTQPT